LLKYENQTVKDAVAETEKAVKEINKMQVSLNKKINDRDEAFATLNSYLVLIKNSNMTDFEKQ